MNGQFINADWPAPANVHGFTSLRNGGQSVGRYASFNVALHVDDLPQRVLQNRRNLYQMLRLPAEPVWLRQVHGNRVIIVDKANKPATPEMADACICRHPRVVCAVLTADCLPILLCNRQGTQIAAIHAGWRGLLAGIIENTVRPMQDTDLMAWLGPAIGPERFEVGADVQHAFVEKSPLFDLAFLPRLKNKWLLDIYQIARIILNSLQVKQIYGGDFCTFSDAQRFYSYRRDGQTGRMVSLIWRD